VPNSYGDFELYAPSDKVAELARTALGRDMWRVEFINTELCELSANLQKNDRVKGVNWNYNYHVVIRWNPNGSESCNVSIVVSEENYAWTVDRCVEKVEQIARSMVEAATRYQELKGQEKPKTKYGSARWGTIEDIKKAGYWGGAGDSSRLVVSPGIDGEYVSITPEDTVKHCIVCGPTGSGKTSSIFVPNLIDRKDKSVLVTEARAGNDPPDLFWKTAYYRMIAGQQKIYHFDPDDLRSNRINPLDMVDSYADARNLAQLIVDNTTSKNNYGDDVWPKSEANMLTTLIAHAAAIGEHLGYIRAMLREGPDGMAKELLASPVHEAKEDYRGFLNTSREGFRYGVVASLTTRLGLWTNPRIVALTQKTDIDFENLAREKFTFYLSVPANKGYLKPVAALIFNFLLSWIQDHHFSDPPFLCLDEFTNFGMIPDIARKLSIIRHQNISVMLGFQDFAQLEDVYDRTTAKNITKQPQTRIFFRPSEFEAAEAISKMAGKTTVHERKITSSGQIMEHETGRRLIEPEEVLTLDKEKMIVFTPGTPPLLLPHFSWEDYQMVTQYGPVLNPQIHIDEDTIKDCRQAKNKAEWQKTWDALKEQEEKTAPKETPPVEKGQKSEKGAPKTERSHTAEKPVRPPEEEPEPEKEKDRPLSYDSAPPREM
jgi:type IV secretion system protein VirD4